MAADRRDKRHLVAERPDFAVSEDFLNMEDPPAAKELELHWEPPRQQRDRNEMDIRQGCEPEEDTEGNQRKISARKGGAPDFNRRPSFEYEDYKKNAYNRLSMFDNRH